MKPPSPPLSNAPSSSFTRPFRDFRPSPPRNTWQRGTRRPLHCARTTSYPPPFEVSSLTSGDYSHQDRLNRARGARSSPFFVLSEESNFHSDRSTREQKVTNCRCSASDSRIQRRRSGRRKYNFAAVPATGAGFEHVRDCVELNKGHPHVEIANCHSHDDLKNHSREAHPAAQSLKGC